MAHQTHNGYKHTLGLLFEARDTYATRHTGNVHIVGAVRDVMTP